MAFSSKSHGGGEGVCSETGDRTVFPKKWAMLDLSKIVGYCLFYGGEEIRTFSLPPQVHEPSENETWVSDR